MKHHAECLIADQPKSNIRCACGELRAHAYDDRLFSFELGRLYEHDLIDGDRMHLAAVVDESHTLRTAVLSLKGTFQHLVRASRCHLGLPDDQPAFVFEDADPAQLRVVAGLGAMKRIR